MTFRCIRHFAIYEQQWPSRVPPHGTSSATPREENAPVEQRHTLRIGPKVLSAACKAKSPVRDEQEESRPSKRRILMTQKVSSAAYRRRRDQEASSMRITAAYRAIALVRDEEEHPPKRRKVQELVSRKMQIVEEIFARRAASESYAVRNASEPVKRKRGRPRLSSPRVILKTQVKVEELQVDIPVVAQPRATNGRFGKKDKSWRKSGEYTGVGSTVARSDDNNDLGSKTPRRKRGIDSVEDFEEPPKKKSTSEQNGNKVIQVIQVEGPAQKVLPRPVSEFRGGRLFSNPNPLRFALHAWATPLILDESSSDEEKQPETPEDGLSSAADIAPAEELMDSMFLPSSILPRAPPLTCKPSPFVFAKNRWNAMSPSFNKLAVNNRRASTNFTPSEGNLRSNLRSNHASSEEEVISFRIHNVLN